MSANRVRLVVVTGLSGSGKTAALKALEDIGFFCVDNLPAALLSKFVQLSVLSGEMITKVGIGMDSRDRAFLDTYREVFDEIAALGITTEVLFLEADEKVLIRRFSETRRVHPLARSTSIPEGIADEKRLLKKLRDRADLVVDTSTMSVHELKSAVWAYFQRAADESSAMRVHLESFGFKAGIPPQADIVMDARFLPNPYFVPELKDRTGEDEEVREFVFGNGKAGEFVNKLLDLLLFLVPLHEAEGKRYLTVAIGCTGGRHRSVAVVRELEARLTEKGLRVRAAHRDVGKSGARVA